jgi:hypothetical protein
LRELFFIALVLACPLMMIFMMRSGHGHGAVHRGHEPDQSPASIPDLRRRRDELDRLIEEHERSGEIADIPIGGIVDSEGAR